MVEKVSIENLQEEIHRKEHQDLIKHVKTLYVIVALFIVGAVFFAGACFGAMAVLHKDVHNYDYPQQPIYTQPYPYYGGTDTNSYNGSAPVVPPAQSNNQNYNSGNDSTQGFPPTDNTNSGH